MNNIYPAPAVVLVRPRLPENIGMAARAMANMGAGDLILVKPERWGGAWLDKAAPPATAKGQEILAQAKVCASLAEALAPFHLALGTTARLSGGAGGYGGDGGWRNRVLDPAEAAREIAAATRQNLAAALVFGPEDTGLENAEIEHCSQLVNIPTFGLSSLNLAQAVLLLLYECAKTKGNNSADQTPAPAMPQDSPQPPAKTPGRQNTRPVTLGEERLLLETMQAELVRLDCIPADNPAWFMRSLRRFLQRRGLERREFDLLMGICRQLRNKLAK